MCVWGGCVCGGMWGMCVCGRGDTAALVQARTAEAGFAELATVATKAREAHQALVAAAVRVVSRARCGGVVHTAPCAWAQTDIDGKIIVLEAGCSEAAATSASAAMSAASARAAVASLSTCAALIREHIFVFVRHSRMHICICAALNRILHVLHSRRHICICICAARRGVQRGAQHHV